MLRVYIRMLVFRIKKPDYSPLTGLATRRGVVSPTIRDDLIAVTMIAMEIHSTLRVSRCTLHKRCDFEEKRIAEKVQMRLDS